MESAVYLLALSDPAGPFKIGLADRAAQRAGAVIGAPLDQLAGESSVAYFPTRSIAARVERLMHAVFAPQRLKTGPFVRTGASEWFARQAFDSARVLLTSQVSLLGGRLVPFRDVLPPPRPPAKPKARLHRSRGFCYGPNAFKKYSVFPCPPWFYVRLLQRTIWELRERLIYFDGGTSSVEFIVDAPRDHPALLRLQRYRGPNFGCQSRFVVGPVVYFHASNIVARSGAGDGDHTEISGPRSAHRWARFTRCFPHGYQRWDARWVPALSRLFSQARAELATDWQFVFPVRRIVRLEPHWL